MLSMITPPIVCASANAVKHNTNRIYIAPEIAVLIVAIVLFALWLFFKMNRDSSFAAITGRF